MNDYIQKKLIKAVTEKDYTKIDELVSKGEAKVTDEVLAHGKEVGDEAMINMLTTLYALHNNQAVKLAEGINSFFDLVLGNKAETLPKQDTSGSAPAPVEHQDELHTNTPPADDTTI